jgi:hypothetical protein
MRIDQEEEVVAEDHLDEEAEDVKPSTGPLLSATNVTSLVHGLRTLQFKKMVHGLPQFSASSTICTSCMVGKQHRNPFPKKSHWRTSQKLQLIHADLCGPITPISNGSKRYLISFIDDFT